MKNMSKKLVSLLLALVMTLSMAMSVFATDHSINVKFVMDGYAYINKTFTETDIVAALNGKAHLYDVPDDVTPQSSALTVADAIIYAYGSYDKAQIDYAWDKTSDPNGLYFTVVDGIITPDAGKYYYVGQNADGEYEYYWEGEAWTLYYNDYEEPATLYASNLELNGASAPGVAYDDTTAPRTPITSITFKYETVREDFTSETWIPGAEPAP